MACNRKCDSIMQEQIGSCRLSFQHGVVANCSVGVDVNVGVNVSVDVNVGVNVVGVWVSWKIKKVEKDEAVNHYWKQE